ncbi:MAG: DUF763 domain-containing protein [bacterium]|nr:DUF763 domain-containing protein [bacterium]
MRTGYANLPLHWGKAPSWLFEKMTKLALEISRVFVWEYGTQEFLKRLSDPYWFQAFGCVLGFDWHSSGLTTTVCGALKEGLRGQEKEVEILVAGGKGRTSRKTPAELEVFGQKYSFDSQPLIYASRMSAKVDSAAIQDGFQIYHHNFFTTLDGSKWAVIQQGMSEGPTGGGWARRYHWLSDSVADFVCEPHSGVACDLRRPSLNLVAQKSDNCRVVTTRICREKPEKLVNYLEKIQTLNLPSRHAVVLGSFKKESLKKIFLKTYNQKPNNFESLLGIAGVGPKTIRALALISELVYGAKPSWEDPAKFSFAHGGKDGTPYPVDRENYQKSIDFLSKAVKKAKIGRGEKIAAIKKLALV